MASLCSKPPGHLLSLCRKILKNQYSGSRTLYTPAALGLDNYMRIRERVKSQFKEMEERFKTKMNDFVAPDSINMVFTEDLKNMLYLVESKDTDLELLNKMMIKFNEQNKDLRFGSFIFGPVIMRTYYTLNKPIEAFEAFKNPKLNGLFDQLGSYQIMLDLLFVNKMYDEVLEASEIIIAKQHQGAKYPKNVVVLTLAACYKKNTPESLKYMTDLWAQLQKCGHQPMRRAVTFAAALAINQGFPHIALELISDMPRQNYVTLRNLKVSALVGLNRLEDALPILRSVLGIDSATEIKQTFYKEVVNKVKDAVEKSGKKEITLEFERIFEQLSSQGHIINATLDEQLCSNIDQQQTNLNQFPNKRMVAASFDTRYPQNRKRFPERPGLADMM